MNQDNFGNYFSRKNFFQIYCVCVSHSVVPNSLQSHGLWLSRLLCPWDSQARILELVAIPFSRGASQPRA